MVDLDRVRELEGSLDAGEASAIVLALELGARQLLMDERRGREVAKAAGLTVTGLVGVALMGKRDGLLPAIGPFLDDLVTRGGMRLAPQVRLRAIVLAGENE